MLKKFIFFYVFVGLCLIALPVLAIPNFQDANLDTVGVRKSLKLPAAAIEHSPVISLGEAVDPISGEMVEGYAIIHYKDQNGKSSHSVKPPKNGASSCYTYLASGAKWKVVEPWIANPTNVGGLTEDFILNNLVLDVGKWEIAAGSVNILGDGVLTSEGIEADTASPDGLNEVYFGSIADSNAIAVTIIWGVFGGPPQNRKLVEWDMIFDEVDYVWSDSGEIGKMDFENIATHELGHSAGLGDLYDSNCSEETMYGYAAYGEIKKRDLNAGDITGIDRLY